MGLKEFFFGEKDKGYDYGALCMPQIPYFGKARAPPKFYPVDEPLPVLLALVMGLQHAFAMVGGLITPPYVVFRFTVGGFPWSTRDDELQQYAIVAALITSGICTIINVSQLPIPFTKSLLGKQLYLGSGILSVMGTSFTFLPIFELAISQMKADGIEGTVAYGKMLGTSMVCCFLEVIFSLTPVGIVEKLFPPLVSAVTVSLIGIALTGTGMKYWGGGVVCAEMTWKEHGQVADLVGPTFRGFAVTNIPSPLCQNGEVSLPYGSAEFIGLGFSVLVFLVVIELFGSTFMKNCNVILALLFGYLIAGVSTHSPSDKSYVDEKKIELAPSIDFLWTEWFPIGFYGPAVLPLLIAYLVTTVETIGDITAVHEVSDLSTEDEAYRERIQGGLLSDAVSSFLASLFTSMPNTTFSQNNGVIALTKVASRRAGYATGFWLIFMGVFAKIAGIITSIPDCVMGGMTIFLFCNVLVSGLALFGKVDLNCRRTRFISAMSLCVGVGVTVWPYAFLDQRASPYTAAFWKCADCSSSMKGLRNGISIFLSTGYCIGPMIAILLNIILPEEKEVETKEVETKVVEEEVVKEEVVEEEVVEEEGVKEEGNKDP